MTVFEHCHYYETDIMLMTHTNGGFSNNRRQLFSSVGELSSSELVDLDAIFWIFVISQLLKRTKIKKDSFIEILLSTLIQP